MIYCFDLDDTLCRTQGTDYAASAPIDERISHVNDLYESGHTIKIHTARGAKTGIDWRQVTESQLLNWGLKYHELSFGKPFADIYIDDKGVSDRIYFNEV